MRDRDKIRKLKRRHVFWRYVLIAIWLSIVWFLSEQSDSHAVTREFFGDYNFYGRKLIHIIEFAVGYFLAFMFFGTFLKKGRKIAGLVFIIVCAGVDEWHQGFVERRDSLATDVLIDCSGALIAYFVTVFRQYLRRGM